MDLTQGQNPPIACSPNNDKPTRPGSAASFIGDSSSTSMLMDFDDLQAATTNSGNGLRWCRTFGNVGASIRTKSPTFKFHKFRLLYSYGYKCMTNIEDNINEGHVTIYAIR